MEAKSTTSCCDPKELTIQFDGLNKDLKTLRRVDLPEDLPLSDVRLLHRQLTECQTTTRHYGESSYPNPNLSFGAIVKRGRSTTKTGTKLMSQQ